MRPLLSLVILLDILLTAGCRNDMADQARYKPLAPSPLFPDGTSARLPPPHTVAAFSQRATGPVRADLRLLTRGQERFDIYCSPCHGRLGHGDGIVTRHGFSNPPDFHSDRLRAMPASHVVQVITEGYGAMFSYADRVTPEDRWAIAGYIRALQLSRRAPVALLSSEDRRQLAGAP